MRSRSRRGRTRSIAQKTGIITIGASTYSLAAAYRTGRPYPQPSPGCAFLDDSPQHEESNKGAERGGLMLIELIAVSERRCSEAESKGEDNGVGGCGGEPVRQQVEDRAQQRRHDRNREKRHKHQRHRVVQRRMAGAGSSWNRQVVLLVTSSTDGKAPGPLLPAASSASGGRRTRPVKQSKKGYRPATVRSTSPCSNDHRNKPCLLSSGGNRRSVPYLGQRPRR